MNSLNNKKGLDGNKSEPVETKVEKNDFMRDFERVVDKMLQIAKTKNHDYSKQGAFTNFKMVENLGITTAEKGILTRMCDKMSRIVNLLDSEAMVEDEKIEDTLIDLANYAIILNIYLKQK